MRVPNKKTLIWSSLGLFISLVTSVFFNSVVGIIVTILLAVVGLISTNISLLLDFRGELDERFKNLENELVALKTELALKAGLPFVSKYLQLQESTCPLFKHASAKVYQSALTELELLGQYQLNVGRLEDVYYWLEILFCHIPFIKEIKATSAGEFKEWQSSDTWWANNYLHIHKVALERGVQIERIFIVRTNYHAQAVESVLRSNAKHGVIVKLAIQGRIQRENQNTNCLLFYNEQKEPVYALVAHHNKRGDFENAVIYGAPHKVKLVADIYHRIDSISEPYSVIFEERSLALKSA